MNQGTQMKTNQPLPNNKSKHEASNSIPTDVVNVSRFDGNPNSLYRTPREQDHKIRHPLYAVWEITLSCDLGCKHCGSRAGAPRKDELSTNECLDVVKQLADLGIREITLIGGEAYLRSDWEEIATAITNSGMACSIQTGARNLTQDRIYKAIKAGISGIGISLDGLEMTHDSLRGVSGSWKAAVNACRQVSDSTLRLTVNTQINRLSLPELPALAELLADVDAKAWQIQLTVAMGRAADRPDLLLQPYDLLDLFPLLVWLKETKLDPNNIALFPGNNIGYFGPYEEILRYGGEKGTHWQGCTAGLWTLGLEADGSIKGCPSLPTLSYTGGSVRKSSIRDVVTKTWELRHLQERSRKDLWGYCQTCYYGDICKGGCTWTSHSLLGKPGNNPYCIHRAIEFEQLGLREKIIKVQPAPGRSFDHGRFEIAVEKIDSETKESDELVGKSVRSVLQIKGNEPGIWHPLEIENRLLKK